MKNLILSIGLVLLTISCSEDKTDSVTGIIGQWKLIEVYADPGDGSGTFQTVESDKKVVFLKDGTVTSNGTICSISTESNNPTSGTFSIAESTISSSDCVETELGIHFEIINSQLILRYPCFEACEEKYMKIKWKH